MHLFSRDDTEYKDKAPKKEISCQSIGEPSERSNIVTALASWEKMAQKRIDPLGATCEFELCVLACHFEVAEAVSGVCEISPIYER